MIPLTRYYRDLGELVSVISSRSLPPWSVGEIFGWRGIRSHEKACFVVLPFKKSHTPLPLQWNKEWKEELVGILISTYQWHPTALGRESYSWRDTELHNMRAKPDTVWLHFHDAMVWRIDITECWTIIWLGNEVVFFFFSFIYLKIIQHYSGEAAFGGDVVQSCI